MKGFWGKLKESWVVLLLAGILCVYVGAICLINFSGRPSFYCTDMYTDMAFAVKVWEQKSLIPEGWLFGNQLYVVATPALAALFCAVAPDPQIAMALAAVTMTVLILVSFRWMLKPVLEREEDRLLCILLFMTLGLYFGDSVGTVNGWQLFFTMCAYYACYLVNVFLSFGCYFQADGLVGKGFWTVFVLNCLLSFGTGIQSLRQTAVMSAPLAVLAGWRLLQDLRQGERWKRLSLLTAFVICLSNVLGLLFKQTIELNQTEIFGQLAMARFEDMLPAVEESFGTMLDLLHCETAQTEGMRIAILVLSVLSGVEFCRRERDPNTTALVGLTVLSLLTIFAIDVGTTLEVRSIYYFMLYLLIAFLLTYGYRRRKALARKILVMVMILSLIVPSVLALKDVCMQAYFSRYDKMYEVSDYLLEEGYTTVYAPWNLGEDIGIASDFEIQMGFWDEAIFEPVQYLCDPAVYEAEPDQCVYALFGREGALAAETAAAQRNVPMNLLTYLPESNVYLYTSPMNLMQEFTK